MIVSYAHPSRIHVPLLYTALIGFAFAVAFTVGPATLTVAQEIAPAQADFDGSGRVNFDDFFLFAAAFGQKGTGENARYDLSKNGEVDLMDFFIFAGVFGKAVSEGSGVAAKYPGDVGIERDSAVVFAENFETGSIEEIGDRWGNISNRDGKVMAFSDDVPPDSGGKRSLQMAGTLGENSGGHLYTVFKPGLDQAYLRFYTKFAADHAYEHHFVALGGYNPPTPWPNPRAGTRPQGDDRAAVFIDPIGWYGQYPPPGIWGLYTYWPEMKISADGKYWGNVLSPAQPVPVPRGRWLCVELMVKLNSAPEKSDGELALWVDGKRVMHFAKDMRRGPWSGMGFNLVEEGGEPFEGLRFRTSMDLKINHLWLEHYIDEGAQRQNKLENPNRINRVWFDNVVVSTQYVGPIQK